MYRLLLLSMTLSGFALKAQLPEDTISYHQQIRKYQEQMNREFADSATSPLTAEDRENFEGLGFYPIDSSYRVTAYLERTPDAKPFKMPTSTGREPMYRQYAIAHFELRDTAYTLRLYQNLGLIKNPAYKDYLFLPFTDHTNGFGSYGGGRYIGLRIPEGDSIVIDFNKAYNPYCAYNYKYSCPIPPEENRLDTRIMAGVKDWEEN